MSVRVHGGKTVSDDRDPMSTMGATVACQRSCGSGNAAKERKRSVSSDSVKHSETASTSAELERGCFERRGEISVRVLEAMSD
jgi:hypothetical protein